MVQQTVDSKFNEYGLGNPEANLPTRDKQQLVSRKKTALRELHNENRIVVPKSNGNFPYSKDTIPIIDAMKASGSKRPLHEFPVSPSRDGNAANGHLVYVRKKFEADWGKTSTSDSVNISSADSMHSRLVGHPENTLQNPQIKEPKVSGFPLFASLPITSFVSPPLKQSVPLLGKSGMKSTLVDSDYHPVASAAPSLDNSRQMRNLRWEERYHQLQMLLKKLDQLDQEDYVQMLLSLSSVELSRHAVELEKRSIQLSLDEVKEVSRVGMLNVLEKSIKNLKEHSTHQDSQTSKSCEEEDGCQMSSLSSSLLAKAIDSSKIWIQNLQKAEENHGFISVLVAHGIWVQKQRDENENDDDFQVTGSNQDYKSKDA